MISKTRQLKTVLILFSLLAFASADFEDLFTNIYSISTQIDSTASQYRYSSLEGGSYLYIRGSGFSTRSASSNKVTVGDYDCPVIEFLTTSTQVVCQLPPSPQAMKSDVRVFVDDVRMANGGAITYSDGSTPQLIYMLPNAANPGDEIFYYGKQRVDSSLEIDYVKIGDFRCDATEQNEFDSLTFNPNSNTKGPCNVMNSEAGYYNVTQKNLESTGLAKKLITVPTYRFDGNAYDFAVIPSIESISNNKGSSEGQIITIQGAGFSTTGANEVYLANTRCNILSQSSTSIQCELGPVTGAIADQGYHAGLKFEAYKNKDIASVKAGTAGTPSWTNANTVAEIKSNAADSYTSKMWGYFKAPVTGNYKFFVSADDRAQLYFSQTPLVKTGLDLIVDVQGVTPYKFFFSKTSFSQISAEIPLVADNYYYMEAYHTEGGGDDYATFGVQIPGTTNSVNNVPEAQSLKLSCDIQFEVLEFKVSNAVGGVWRIRLDYLSSDGKKVDRSATTTNITYDASASSVSNIISGYLGLRNTVVKEMLASDGTTTTNQAQATTVKYQVTLQNFRKNGKLPVIESNNLEGSSIDVKVTQVTAPSSPLSGSFTLQRWAKTVEIASNAAASTVEQKLRDLGYLDPIRVVQYGDADVGLEWRIQFTGEGAGPVDLLSIGSNTLSGCKDPSTISVQASTLQESSQDLFYEVIPFNLLYTAESNPQITVKSNGITGNCPNFNCDYVIQTDNLPLVSAISYSPPTVAISLDNVPVGKYTTSDFVVSFANTKCEVLNFDDSLTPVTLDVNCPTPEAGDFYPRIHFDDIGYAKVASGVQKTTIQGGVSAITPLEINPNGGSTLTITGSGFPLSLEIAQTRELQVQIGGSACNLNSVSPAQIKCTTTAVSGASSVTVALNQQLITSTDTLTLATIVPTIDSISPTSVNPVLQSDVIITGTNFDNDASSTKIYLTKPGSTDPTTECLVFSSTPTQITCKLLGAPTGSYNLYVKTSLGNSNSQAFSVKTVITSVSPSSGSNGGGTLLTIQGGTFSNDVQQTLVFIGDDNIACDVISSTTTEIKCRTQAKSKDYASGAAQEVVVTTRLVEESLCENGANTCKFTFSDSLTPVVSSVSTNSTFPGSDIEITGTGFESIPAGSLPVITIGGANANLVSHTDTKIVFTVPANIIPNKAATLIVSVTGKGYADFGDLPNTIQVAPRLDTISPSTGSKSGVLVTFTGAGFQNGIVPKIGNTACEIRSLTSTTIVCKTTTQGAASLDFKDFTAINCTGTCSLTFGNTQTPTIASLSTPTPSSGTFSTSVTGTLFNLGDNAVTLISSTDKTVTFAGTVTPGTATSLSVSFTDVPAGTYNVELASGGNIATSTATVSIPLTASTVAAVTSSIAGGVSLSISGTGFFANAQKDKNKVTVCGLPCQVTQSSTTSIQCDTPLFVNAAVKSTYADVIETSLLEGTAWSDSKQEGNVFDLAFTTVYKSSLTNCEIGLDVGAHLLAELSEIKYFPDPATTASKLNGTVIEGSNDKSTYTTIATIDANAHDGWNTITVDGASPVRYRYLRLRGGSSSAKCALAELQFFGILLSDNTATDLNAINCGATVTVGDKSQDAGAAVNYRQSSTAVLTSISPEMGTSAGGTTITLTGTGFDTTLANVKVTIDDVDCTVATATSTEITCITGPAPDISNRRSSLESELKIFFKNNGYAITNDAKYFYVDKWSDESTWGGITPPREGDSVHIPAGQTILLDISPPKLKAIIVEGALIFDDTNIDLHCEYIFIRNGRLQIGTWENPIQSKITVTLYGNKESPQLPTFGNKVIALMEGILDIHGKPRSYTWTLLDRTAEQGETSIVVQGNVDWVAGEEIVIASTDHDHYQSESRTILSAAKDTPSAGLTKLTFADPLKFKHYAAIQTIGGVDFEMRAEVGLLTRNVVIQGDESSKKLMYGVHIMSHSPTGDDSSIGRISYTEVRQAGQAFNLGRYAIHFHLIGNTRESYVIGNAIHHSYNRAVTIHGVHFLKVQKNVAYWCMGHTIFIEDGIETHNVIEDNLVINTIASSALLNTDQTPASFWITNPNNIWRRNHAAGSDRYGFWFDLRAHPEGPSATTSICPTGEKLGEFTDNQAHSSGRYGLRIFHELIPRTYPCLPYDDFVNNPPVPAEFKNFLGWKNRRDAIIGERLGAVTFKNIKAADNHRAGIEISDGDWSPPFTLKVEDAWIVGVTPDNAADTAVYQDKAVRGLMTPKKDYFLAKNVHFYNYGDSMTAIETCSHCEHGAATDAGARTAYFEGLTFNNVQQKVRFNVPYREILIDNDGSLTGNSAGKGVVTFYYEHLDVPGCTRNENVYDGLVCDETITIRKIEFIGIVTFENFAMQDLEILRIEDNPSQLFAAVPYREKPRKSWSVGFVTGYTYQVSWASRADFTSVNILPSKVIDPADKTITLSFNHSEYRETYDVSSSINPNISNVTTLWDSNPSSAQCGVWYHDVEEQKLYMAINANNRQDIKPKAVKCRVNCPLPASMIPKDGVIRLWSNATQWPNQKVPVDGDDVVIPGNWTIKLDVNTAKLNKLHIIGDFFFDNTKDDLTLTAQYIWLEGQMFIGNDTYNRYTKNAKILLTGVRNTEGLIIGPVQDVSNKVLAVTGNLTIYGNDVNTVYTRLQAPAKVGDTTITVPSSIDWKVGDQIMIAPTQRNPGEFEDNTITAISNGVITLQNPIKYFHFGAGDVTKVTDFGTLDMRAEVGLLTRNIVIEGTNEDTWGGRVYVGEIYDPTIDDYLRGRAELEGVEMRNLGQSNTNLAGLTFERLVTGNNGPSSVKKCVMRDTEGYQLRVIGTDGLTVDSNVFYKSRKYQIRFEDQNSNIKFTNNLAVGNQDRGLRSDHAKDMITTFYSDAIFAGDSDISNNIFAGCYGECAIARGGDCSTQADGPYIFKNNVGHSGETGLVASDPNPACNGITHFTTYKVDLGVVTYFKSKSIQASNLIITDALKGVSLNTGAVNDATISFKNSYLAGVTPTGSAESHSNPDECSQMVGIMVPQSTDEAKSIPPSPTMLPWWTTKGNHIYRSTFTVTGITLENYKDNIVPGCVKNYALRTNPAASDYSATTQISGITANNIGISNRVYFEEAQDGWVGLDDCGGWHCTGIRNVIIRDVDGSFTGEPTSLMPANPFTIDKNTCYKSDNENANICKTPGWGILTFQSLDVDMFTRLLSPVYVTSAKGFSNKVNSYMDHVWDGFYTGLKRLSRFHSVAQSGEAYQVNLTGTLPNTLLWQYQGASDNEGISVEYGYANPQSVKVTNSAGVVVKPSVLKTAAEKVIRPEDPCGTNLYNVDTRRITIKLTGEADCRLNIALTNSLHVTVRYSITVDEFFNQNGAAAFVDKLAAVLKINPASIRIVDVRSGSTILETYIDSSHQEGTTDSDALAKAELNQMKETLKTAIDSGNLRVLDSEILNSSLEVSLVRRDTETPAATTSVLTSGDTMVIVIIAVVFGVIALAVGSYLAYVRYTKKRVFPTDAEQLKGQTKIHPIGSQQEITSAVAHTENPLYFASSRVMDMSSRSPELTMRSPEASPTKFEPSSPS